MWAAPAEAELAQLTRRQPRLAQRILTALARYAATGYGNVRQLQGSTSRRLRVGDWRIIFDQEPGRIVVRAVNDRKDVYRRR